MKRRCRCPSNAPRFPWWAVFLLGALAVTAVLTSCSTVPEGYVEQEFGPCARQEGLAEINGRYFYPYYCSDGSVILTPVPDGQEMDRS